MTKYNHTAAEALSCAKSWERKQALLGKDNLAAKEYDLIVTALKFLADYSPHMFKKGDKIVPLGGISDLSKIYEVKADVRLVAVLEMRAVDPTYFRLATTDEEALGHRIDEVQDET